jgi:hypothetical protein
MENASISEHKRQLMLKAQDQILQRVLPAIQQTADELIAFMSDEDDTEEITHLLREVAVETVLDELVKLLTRDPNPVSARYILLDKDGIDIDSLIASYDELKPDKARRWYARQMDMTPEEHAESIEAMPAQLPL